MQGVVDGILAPERLLGETGLTSRVDPMTPVPPTAETAERFAKAVRARWTTIYTLRKSPLEAGGIKLIHNVTEDKPRGAQTNMSFNGFIQSALTNRFNLNPEA